MGAGTFILAAGYARTATVAVTCMCIGVAASGLMHSGYNVNMLDIAPRYACVIMGLTNTVGTITGFLSPMMVGYITVNKVSLKQMHLRQHACPITCGCFKCLFAMSSFHRFIKRNLRLLKLTEKA